MLKRLSGLFEYREKGFTLVEILVVILILGVLAAVAVPRVAQFMGEGKSESYSAELHNIQTATSAMLAESKTKRLVSGLNGIERFDQVVTTDTETAPAPLVLTDYLKRLKADLSSKTRCTYDFTEDGAVTQHPPAS